MYIGIVYLNFATALFLCNYIIFYHETIGGQKILCPNCTKVEGTCPPWSSVPTSYTFVANVFH